MRTPLQPIGRQSSEVYAEDRPRRTSKWRIRWRAQKQFSRVFLGNLIGYGPIHAHNALRIISSLLFIKQIMFTNVVSVNRTATIIEQSRNQHSDGASP